MKKKNRRVQLLESGPAVQEGIQLLSHSNLHPVLHARYRVLGVLLAGSERRACPGVTRYKLLSKCKHHVQLITQNYNLFYLLTKSLTVMNVKLQV